MVSSRHSRVFDTYRGRLRQPTVRIVWLRLCGAGIFLVACGPGASAPDAAFTQTDAQMVDATAGVTSPAMPSNPATPQIPWLEGFPVDQPPCPEGWLTQALSAGPRVCLPWPIGTETGCPPGQAWFAGDDACAPIGGRCVPGAKPARGTTTAAGVIYVSALAGSHGDGSRRSPLRSIADAVKRSAPGGTVVLGPGRFAADLRITKNVTIRGACTGTTILTSVSSGAHCLYSLAADVKISDLHIEDCGSAAIWMDGATLDLERVAILRPAEIGVAIINGTGHLSRVEIADAGSTRPEESTIGVGVHNSIVTLNRVVIERTHGQSIAGVFGSTLVIEDSVIRDGQLTPIGAPYSSGILVAGSHASIARTVVLNHPGLGIGAIMDGHLTVTDSVVSQCNLAVVAEDSEIEASSILLSDNVRGGLQLNASTVSAEDAVIIRTTAGADAFPARAFGCEIGGNLTLRRAYIAATEGFGGLVSGVETTALLEDVHIHQTGAAADGSYGRAIEVSRGGKLRGRRLRLTENRQGLISIGLGSEIEIDDVVMVADPNATWPSNDDPPMGVSAEAGGALTIRRAVAEDVPLVSVRIIGSGSRGRISDLTATRTRGVRVASTPVGIAVAVASGATLEGERWHLRESEGQGLLAGGGLTRLDVTDLVVEGTVPARDGIGGYGAVIVDGANVTMDRAWLHDNREAAIAVQAALLSGSDLTIEDTISRTSDGEGGRGLIIQQGASTMLSRLRIARSHDLGIAVAGEGSIAQIDHASIQDTRSRRCLDGDICGGIGIASYLSGRIEMSHFAISESALCGVLLAADGQIDLRSGHVVGNDIGVCLQVPGYDLERLRDEVAYEQNGRAIDSTDLPIPITPDFAGQ